MIVMIYRSAKMESGVCRNRWKVGVTYYMLTYYGKDDQILIAKKFLGQHDARLQQCTVNLLENFSTFINI